MFQAILLVVRVQNVFAMTQRCTVASFSLSFLLQSIRFKTAKEIKTLKQHVGNTIRIARRCK